MCAAARSACTVVVRTGLSSSLNAVSSVSQMPAKAVSLVLVIDSCPLTSLSVVLATSVDIAGAPVSPRGSPPRLLDVRRGRLMFAQCESLEKERLGMGGCGQRNEQCARDQYINLTRE